MMLKTYLTAALCLLAASSRVHADDSEVDVRSFEYVDVVETSDGSVWKGIVIEQTPNVSFKIATADGSVHVIKAADVVKMTKQKNKDYRAPVAAAATPATTTATGTAMQPNGVSSVYQPSGSGLPAPVATSGVRLDPSLAIVFPAGDIKGTETSFAPDVRFGYEALFGNFGLGGGGLARFSYWRLPMGSDPNDAAWTLETHAYGRAAVHISRAAIFGGVSLGVDTNYVHMGQTNTTKTAVGFGMNLQTGVEIAASQAVGFKLGFDYHPGTDTIVDGAPQSISFYSLIAGASLRL